MAKKAAESNWYEVVDQSYINERLYLPGERVQYDGDAGPNLRKLSADELKDQTAPQTTPDDELAAREKDADKREAALDQREKDATAKEANLQLKEADLEKQTEALNERAKELDEREAAIAAKEKPVDTASV